MTKITFCGCKHKYQDEKYGEGKRVFNRMKAGNKEQGFTYRCTVCKNEKKTD